MGAGMSRPRRGVTAWRRVSREPASRTSGYVYDASLSLRRLDVMTRRRLGVALFETPTKDSPDW